MLTTCSNIPTTRNSHACLTPPVSNTPRKRATTAWCHVAVSEVATKRTTSHEGQTMPMDDGGEG
ncbi:hypothetical protein K443DRAFT_10187 [Laccaria amethystina LaAM-08-1]|uniref:Uncharacterized protein n=1 Tax=Laccaria amethystina LaAM-08-1 TaxID=1095629 RepID=A0A0C9WWP1_9AGAR|nr:hypothetical protein K443DRAFT_10187 [Laccaria amethystina LaAM-08-1]